MKWTGLSAAACTVALAVACSNGAPAEAPAGLDGLQPQPAHLPVEGALGTSGQAPAAHPHGQVHGDEGDARYFAEHAAIAGNAEVELGQLALGRSRNPQVRAYADMMVRDHARAGAELRQALTTHDVVLSNELDVEHRQLKERLTSLSGDDFDREYMKAMVDGHKEMASLVDGRVRSAGTSPRLDGLDAAVTQWASKAQPTLNEHLRKAEQIHAALR